MTEAEFGAKLIELIDSITGAFTALTAQTAAITALVESNQRLMMILAEGMEEEDELVRYLDGSPK